MSYELTFPSSGAAFVLGGSGGAGAAICEQLGHAGTPVAFTYFRGEDRARRTVETLKSVGAACECYQLDGRDSDSVADVVTRVADKFGGIHSVVCATGPALDFTPISELSPARWRESLEADATSIFNVAHASMPYLREAKGSFTACVTVANRRVLELDGASAAPKAAVESLVRQLAAEEGRHGVRANCVGLGWIEVGVGQRGSEQYAQSSFGDEAFDWLLAHIRLGRAGIGPELASAAVYLASQQASYVTGQILTVDGGLSL